MNKYKLIIKRFPVAFLITGLIFSFIGGWLIAHGDYASGIAAFGPAAAGNLAYIFWGTK